MTIIIDEFLEPWHGQDANEFHHTLAETVRSSSVSQYNVVGQIEIWQAFHVARISSSLEMRASLDKRFAPRWQAWLSDLARVIYSEKQLESLYYRTLVTRVNIALYNAILSDDPRVTIINYLGAFDPNLPNSAVTAILPD